MLTEREKEILEIIINYIEKNQYVPSVREICKLAGLKSPSTVHKHLTKLENKGYVKRKEKSPRALKILRSPEK